MSDKKTIQEWEQLFEINILDIDGFDQTDRHLYEKLFTRTAFEQAIASCTIMHKLPKQTGEAIADGFIPDMRQANSSQPVQPVRKVRAEKTNMRKVNWRTQKWLSLQKSWTYVVFPLPAIATFVLLHLYRWFARKFTVDWYWIGGIGLLNVFIIILEPITPLLSGPLFIWYLIFGELATLSGQAGYQIYHTLLHKMVLPPQHQPFLSSFNLFGNPMNFYFSVGKAVTSSIVIAAMILCVRDLLSRHSAKKSAR